MRVVAVASVLECVCGVGACIGLFVKRVVYGSLLVLEAACMVALTHRVREDFHIQFSVGLVSGSQDSGTFSFGHRSFRIVP